MEEGGSSYFLALMPLRVAGAAAGVFGGGYKGREPVKCADDNEPAYRTI